MATLVLVHGAMHGGWCWRDVRHELQAKGHEVYTPTLTGQGERRKALTPDVGVPTHVADIAELLWFEDLNEVHLVLHSYAGVLAGPLAEREGGRLASVIYLAAFVTAPGQCLLDVEPHEVAWRYRRMAEDAGEGWFVPASSQFLDQWGVAEETVRERVAPRLTDFPLRCQTDATEFDPSALEGIRRIYINHTGPPLASLQPSFDSAVRAGWETYELPYGHDMMLTAPEATAGLLDWIAGGLA